MSSQKSIVRKAVKAKARRKDYVKKRNMNNNVPTTAEVVKKDIFKSVTTVLRDPKSKKTQHVVRRQVVGTKDVIKKEPKYYKKDDTNRLISMVAYPNSRKYKVAVDPRVRLETLIKRRIEKTGLDRKSAVAQVIRLNPKLAKKVSKLIAK
jgi:hypothetical protein